MSDMDDTQPAPTPIKPVKYVCIDTETSGLPRYKGADGKPIPADAEGQPRLAELAMVFLREDLSIEREIALYVRPSNWKMDPGATEANGLTDEFLNEHGREITLVLEEYRQAIEDDGRVVAAFGAQFDCKIMRGELRRAGMSDMFDITPNTCLMRACQGLGIKKANGKGGWPQLSDVLAHFCIKQEGAHTGLGDARAVAALLPIFIREGILQPPGIHKAKGVE
jgi:DNA polymerase III epsilon subunit-like protein